MSEKNTNNNENLENAKEEKNQVYEMENLEVNERPTLKSRKYMNLRDKTDYIDLTIYNELDDFAAEVLDSDNFLKYVNARREYLFDSNEAIKKYFGDEFLNNKENENKINTFSEFYYEYMIRYSDCYLYEFMAKGYTDGFRELLIQL